MANNDNYIDTITLFDDVLKSSKSARQFGPTRIYRVKELPSDDFGRNGDLAVIDDTAETTSEITGGLIPQNVGFCQKVPVMVPSGPNSTSSTVNGADLTGGDEFSITVGDPPSYTITLPADPVFVGDAAEGINAASIPGVSARFTQTYVEGTVANPVAGPGDSITINTVVISWPVGATTNKVIGDINAASIPFVNAGLSGGNLILRHSRGGSITLAGPSVGSLFGTPATSGGILYFSNEGGKVVSLTDDIGTPLATMGFPLSIPASALTVGGQWELFGTANVFVENNDVPIGSFNTLNFLGTGVSAIVDVGGQQANITLTDAQNLWETVSADIGSVTASGPTDTITIAGGSGIATSIVGNTLTITNTSATQDLWETIASDAGSTTANTPTDTLTIAGGTGISTAVAGDTLTITNDSPNIDQNLWETIASDAGSTTANTPTDTLTIAGGTGISTAVAGDTLTITNDAPSLITISTINGQPVPTFADSGRSKQLSVGDVSFMFGEGTLSDLDWMDVGNANGSLTGYQMPLNGTIIYATYHIQDDNGNAKELDLYINGAMNTTLFTASGLSTEDSGEDTILNIDFSQGDKLQVRAGTTGGSLTDVVVVLHVRWRA